MPNSYVHTFVENTYYHVYCRAVGDSVLFKNDEKRRYFLQQYRLYLEPYFQTACYILLGNHVHWLVKTRAIKEIAASLAANSEIPLKKHQQRMIDETIDYNAGIEFQFRDFLIGYAKAYNKMFQRKGALFISPFRRIEVKTDAYFSHLVVYIHANAKHHGIAADFENYEWSSYQQITSSMPSWLMKEELMEWFGGKEWFIDFHRTQAGFYYGPGGKIEENN
jgi:putative transposase